MKLTSRIVVCRRLWALCLARCLPPPSRRPRALAAQGRRLASAGFRSSAPQTHRSAFRLPSVTCPTLAVLRGCGQQPDPGCFHASRSSSVLYPRFRMHAHPTLQRRTTPTPAPATVSDPARLTVSLQSASHARSRFCPAVSCPSTVPFFAQVMKGRAVEWSREVTKATRQPVVLAA